MKRYTLIIYLLISFKASYSQTDVPTTVYTCKGGSVAAFLRSEFSQSDITYYTNYTSSTYSYLGITIIGNASRQYNCHAYAWHLTEGNTNKVWINNTNYQNPVNGCFPENNNIHKYWTDGCFIQVCDEADADKAHYSCGDHSAVKSTTNPGYYESKWGQLALVRHLRTSVPYNTSSINYYASAKITGSTSNLCSGSRTFSVKNISGATYAWTYSSTLSVVGATNTNQLTVQRNGSSNGGAWVQVVINTSCSSSSATTRQDFTVGTPNSLTGTYSTATNTLSLQTINFVPVGNIYAQYQWPGISNITATLTSGSPPGTGFYSFPGHFSFNIASGQQVSVYLTGTGACGSVDATRTFIQSSYYYLVVSPNPATNNINVGIREMADTSGKIAKEQKLITSNTSGITKMYLYDFNTGILIKQWNFNEMKTSNYDLNISGVKSGVYLLKMERNNKSTSTKIIVK